MLKAKTNKDAHKSRTLSDAIKDVKQSEMAQISFSISKNIRKKFKRKAEDNNTSMQKVLEKYIYTYLES